MRFKPWETKEEIPSDPVMSIDDFSPPDETSGKGESAKEYRSPYLAQNGELIIPFDSDPKYHWWTGRRQIIGETLKELGAIPEVLRRYIPKREGRPKERLW